MKAIILGVTAIAVVALMLESFNYGVNIGTQNNLNSIIISCNTDGFYAHNNVIIKCDIMKGKNNGLAT